MPGLIFRSATLASPMRQRIAACRQLLLLLCLLCVVDQSFAQATGIALRETEAASGNERDAILSGMEITRRVLGGDDSEPDDWPSVVALVRPGTSRLKDRFFCGGTIVAEHWVMTAAHCLFDAFGRLDDSSRIRVIAGIHDLVDDMELEEVRVTNIIVHPDYDNTIESPPNDIALLELATVLDAPVGELFVGESENYTGTISYIVGWGATRFINENAAQFPNTQQEAPVPLVSLATCNSAISYAGLIAVTQLCAGYAEGQIDTCAGDSGGPLNIVENGRVIQVGITSFGNGCGQENFYGIYTNVSHYIPWLGNYITVPVQSLDLIASREAATNGGMSDDSTGAISLLYLFFLVSASLVRRLGCTRLKVQDRSLWRSSKKIRILLLVPLGLLMSACTVPSIGAQVNSANTVVLPLEEKSSMSDVHTMVLNGESLRAGIDGLQLGATHQDSVSNLSVSYWQLPVCESGKTALLGTGRLFQTEHCAANAAGSVMLYGHRVRKLDLFLLDQQLVRIDVLLADTSANGVSTDLTDLLEGHYQQAGTTPPGKEDGSVQFWRHREDQIWLYSDHNSLLFIDGRLKSSLPALYEFKPPFDID